MCNLLKSVNYSTNSKLKTTSLRRSAIKKRLIIDLRENLSLKDLQMLTEKLLKSNHKRKKY